MPEEPPSGQTPIPEDEKRPQPNAYQQHRERLRYILQDRKQQRTFGIEWIIRVFLVLEHYLYPSLLVRTLMGKFGFIWEHVGVELYVLGKILLFALLITYRGYDTPAGVAVAAYLLSETVFYLLSLIFLSDIYAPPVSWKRSVLLLMLNFVEITLAFAALYLATQPLKVRFSHPFEGVFFSFITSAGRSYGEFIPTTFTGQVLVICHAGVMLVFLILIAQYVTNSLEALKKPSQIET